MGYIPPCVAEKKPFLNRKFKNLQSAFEFYREYGRVCGFDIRKAQEKSDCLGITTLKYFVCSRSGSSDTRTTKSKDGFESYKHGKQSLKMWIGSLLYSYQEIQRTIVVKLVELNSLPGCRESLQEHQQNSCKHQQNCHLRYILHWLWAFQLDLFIFYSSFKYMSLEGYKARNMRNSFGPPITQTLDISESPFLRTI
ncbi:hypothetical protein ACET3Z_018511 [Daucus carota]